MKFQDDDIREIEELPDGSAIYKMGREEKQIVEGESFHENLAVEYPDDARKKLSSYLLKSFSKDLEARASWLEPADKARKYLGFQLEDLTDLPFKNAVRTFDGTLSNALMRAYAMVRSELLGERGVAGYEIIGETNEQIEESAERRKNWLNYFLTVKDAGFYADYEKFILYTLFYGTGIRKIYFDPIKQEPVSRFITPHNFVIDADCSSILDSDRIVHILHLSRRDVILNQQNGIYRDVDLPYLKNPENDDAEDEDDAYIKDGLEDTSDNKDNKNSSLYTVLEFHAYLNLEDFTNTNQEKDTKTVPSPYIVTIDKKTKEVFSIRRNWEEEDQEQTRIEYFDLYKYAPGFGIYGLGLAHTMGSNAISATALLNILIDASVFKNMPGGVRVKGMTQQDKHLNITPGAYVEVDTGGVSLGEAFMNLPYDGPCPTTYELLLHIIEQNKEKGSISELGMLSSKEDIPTGTAIAQLEAHNKVQSGVLRAFHFSLDRELRMIDKLFSQTIEEERFIFNASENVINQDDFIDNVKIIPISDPANNSSIQKMMKAEAVLNIAMQMPELHNLPEVLKYLYSSYNFSDSEIDKIVKFPEPEEEVMPTDPITCYMNILLGKPVQAFIWQDHDAYITVLQLSAGRPEMQENPEALANLQALVTQHQAFKYLLEMQQMLGVQLPPLEQIENPQLQNAIAMQLAKVMQEKNATQEDENAQLDPNALIRLDIEQKQAETESRERIATQKTESDVFKAQLNFEADKAKIESAEAIAKLKAETELNKEECKLQGQTELTNLSELTNLE